MDFRHHPLTLQFLGFLNTQSLFDSDGFSGFPTFEISKLELSETMMPDQELPDKLILGKRIEYFFAYYIRHYTSEKILFENQVISRNRITLGELDFILQNTNTGKISHIELVYKYYLYDPGFDEGLHRWIGPNRRDSLVRKLEKLRHHQFPLLFRPESREILEPVTGPVEKIDQQICFKANFFVPLEMQGQQPFFFQRSEITGYWIRQEDFSEETYGDQLFCSPKKRDWPIDPKYCCTWHSFQEISQKIAPLLSRQSSPLLWMKKKEGSTVRFFIVWW